MPSELKPCPFCGGRAVLVTRIIKKPAFCSEGAQVICGECRASGRLFLEVFCRFGEDNTHVLLAINAWNTRFPPKKRSKKEIIQLNQEINKARKERLLNKEKENET